MEYYNTLNLPFDATAEEVRAAYFDAAKKHHPDAQPDASDGGRFIEIQQAYEILSNEKKRRAYDRSLPDRARAKTNAVLDISFSRTGVPSSTDPQLLYVLMNIDCGRTIEALDLPPVHICIILDRSSSMRGERLDMVRTNISQLIRKLREGDVVSLVTFSDRAEVLVQPGEITDPKKFDKVLMGISAGGATEIYQGMELGYEIFRRYAGRSNSIKHLLLVTDGHTYGDEDRCLALAAKANTEGISINTLGIGHDWNDAFLDQLAATSGGSTVFVKDRQDMIKFVEEKIQSLSMTYSRKTEIHLSVPENVTLEYAFKIFPDVIRLDGQFPMQVGALEYGRKTSLILEFKIDPLKAPVTETIIASGKMVLDVPTRLISTERVNIDLRLPIHEEWMKEKVPTAILAAISRLSLYRLQEKARDEAFAGDIEAASRHLKYLATRLIAGGNLNLAQSALMEVEHLEKYKQLSEEGKKEIKYGTRSLFLLPGPELQKP